MSHYFSFDVESVGLFGSPFAVGWVVVNNEGDELMDGYLACPMDEEAPEGDLQWIEQNVLPTLPQQRSSHPVYANCTDLSQVCRRFWMAWTKAKLTYSDLVMVTDCPFPVEAEFLLCVANQIGLTLESSPYPIIDVASVLLAAGRDPLEHYDRLPAELPAHNPVNDARQSVRLMLETFRMIATD